VCTWRRNRILCKYPNQIHILKFNCFIQKFYLPKKPKAKAGSGVVVVWQTRSRLEATTMPPIFNLFPLFHLKRSPSTPRSPGSGPAHTFIRSPYPVRASGGVCRVWGWCYQPPVFFLPCTKKNIVI